MVMKFVVEKFLMIGVAVVLLLPVLSYGDVRVITADEPPTNYKENDEVVGTTVDIVRALIKELNSDSNIEFMPWSRAIKLVSENPNIAVFTAGKTKQRIDHGYYFIGPVMTRKHVLWKRADRYLSVSSIEDIKNKNYRVGALRGDWRGKLFEKNNVEDVRKPEQNLEKLLRGRIDLWVTSDIEAPSVAKSISVDIKDIAVAYVIKEAPSYIMLSKDTPSNTVRAWEAALIELQKTDFFEKVADKWKEKLGLDLSYADDKGFYIK